MNINYKILYFPILSVISATSLSIQVLIAGINFVLKYFLRENMNLCKLLDKFKIYHFSLTKVFIKVAHEIWLIFQKSILKHLITSLNSNFQKRNVLMFRLWFIWYLRMDSLRITMVTWMVKQSNDFKYASKFKDR